MKNIHILPTDQPSRLAYYSESTSYNHPVLQMVSIGSSDYKYQNLYITSSEEIKEDDWYVTQDGKPIRELFSIKRKGKIILTTDPTLIAEGVQSIDDEFLEWLIKNSSCEFVEVFNQDVYSMGKWYKRYKILIPQEEPKKSKVLSELFFDKQGNLIKERDGEKVMPLDNENIPEEEETLEEVSMVLYPEDIDDHHDNSMIEYDCNLPERIAFIAGAKWQAERMYNEIEVNEIISAVWINCEDNEGETFTEVRKRILEQFKKK